MAKLSPRFILAFDMFETLVQNQSNLWKTTFNEITEAQSLPISGSTLYEEWRNRDLTFRSTRTNMACPQESPPFRTYFAAWKNAFEQTFSALQLDGNPEDATSRCVRDQARRPAYPDSAHVIPRLARKGMLGLISNADQDYLDRLVERQDWQFNPMVTSESAQAYKPDPRIFEDFLRQVEVPPEQVFFVGDSIYDDIHGAKSCGFKTIWIKRGEETPGSTPIPSGTKLLSPDIEIKSLYELEDLFDQIIQPH